ncbi:MAG: hypothetical protein IJN35_03335, partial [Muribaculaceae bacterium]|nr:hypothetical protein [Muribaculaceae bacterium]
MKLKNILITIIASIAIIGIVIISTRIVHVKPQSTQQVSSGTVEYYPDFQSQYITPRNVVVWLPDNYT